MKISKLFLLLSLTVAVNVLSSCNDKASYADLIEDERKACNAFLSNFEVREVPADSVFETGPNAPYYKLEPEGRIYMQVIKTGDLSKKAKAGQNIYFRFTRYNLNTWYRENHAWVGNGNADDMSQRAVYFKYQDFELESSREWGYGLQMPLAYLGVNCEVNLVIKSKFGRTQDIGYGLPFMYHVRYFPSKV